MHWVICLCCMPLWQSAAHPPLTIAAIWRHWRVQRHFAEQPDPSARSVASYKLEDIVMITLCAVVSGFEHWIAIEDFGNEHEPWLRTCSGNISDNANGIDGLWLTPMARLLGHDMQAGIEILHCHSTDQYIHSLSSACNVEYCQTFRLPPY